MHAAHRLRERGRIRDSVLRHIHPVAADATGQPIHAVNPEVPARARTPGNDAVEALILDLLEWIGSGARPYSEVMEAWRSSCPRLPAWEEAVALTWSAVTRRVASPR